MTDEGPIRSTLEQEHARVVAYNVSMFEHDMWDLLGSESWGGNAGGTTINGEKYACAAANSWVDQTSGKILFFTNDPVPNTKGLIFVTFVVADEGFHPRHLGASGKRIIEVLADPGLTADARARVDVAVERYNASHPFGQTATP